VPCVRNRRCQHASRAHATGNYGMSGKSTLISQCSSCTAEHCCLQPTRPIPAPLLALVNHTRAGPVNPKLKLTAHGLLS
jgi:hypothetical protein